MTPIPLTDMEPGDRYKGEEGGLYGAGRNTPPREHLQAALREASCIQPLAPNGGPSPSGRIALLSIGFSNAYDEFEEFLARFRDDTETSPTVRGVNAAQTHMGTPAWAAGASKYGDPWTTLVMRLEQAGASPWQVQAAWIKMAPPKPAELGEYPEHARRTKQDLSQVVRRLGVLFPKLRIAYFSSRAYAGYARTPLSPEPYAYEDAFALRGLIQDQAAGDPGLNWDPSRGSRRAPLLLWGPYLWADGHHPRKLDGLTWEQGDFEADGTHPSRTGSRKVAGLLLEFFKTDPTAKTWFLQHLERKRLDGPGHRA